MRGFNLQALCVIVCAMLVPGEDALAQVKSSAEIRTPGMGVPVNVAGNIGAAAMGSTVSAAKVFNPVKRDYKVNGAAANATEVAAIESLIKSSLPLVQDDPRNRAAYIKGGDIYDWTGIPFGGPRPANKVATVEGLQKLIPKNTAPKAAPAAFTLVAKVPAASNSGVMNLSPNPNKPEEEFADATASQTAAAGGMPFRSRETTLTSVNKPGKLAYALAVNRDPAPVIWDSSSHDITIDFTGVSFPVESLPDGSAFAVYNLSASIIDGVSDPSLPEDTATPIYDFLFSVFSDNGAAPFFDTETFTFEVYDGQVTDSLSNSGSAAVKNALMNQLVLTGNELRFQGPYSVTITPTGTSSQSLLFTRHFGFTGAIVPEPATPGLLLAGLAVPLLLRLRNQQWRNRTQHLRDSISHQSTDMQNLLTYADD